MMAPSRKVNGTLLRFSAGQTMIRHHEESMEDGHEPF